MSFPADFLDPPILKKNVKLNMMLAQDMQFFYGKASSSENPVSLRLNDQDDFRTVFREENPPPELNDLDNEDQNDHDNFDEIDDDLPF